MKIVTKDSGLNAPGYCVFTKDVDGPFLDTKRWLNDIDPYGYVQVDYVKEMGRAVGMVDPGDVAALKQRVSEMALELEELRKIAGAIEDYDTAKATLEAVAA